MDDTKQWKMLSERRPQWVEIGIPDKEATSADEEHKQKNESGIDDVNML